MNRLKIDLDKCVGCGKCARMCMKGHIVVEDRKARELDNDCLGCSHCVSSCPKGAIVLLPKEAADEGLFDSIKKDKMFDGGMVSEEDLEQLYYAMDHGKRRCEFFTLQGEELNAFMETLWSIVKDAEADTPLVKEWAAWRDGHDILQPNPVLWEGNQVLFIFADSPDRAFIASNRMIVKGLDLGVRGFHSNLIMTAYKLDRDRVLQHFPRSTKELYMAYVIGHARRLVEPVFKPITKLKGLFDRF
jgi:NAD-dependent dihydropyrimidine dehydrogenase PreA subunit